MPPGPHDESSSPLLRHTIPKHSIGVILRAREARELLQLELFRESDVLACHSPAARHCEPRAAHSDLPDTDQRADDARPQELLLHLRVDQRHGGRCCVCLMCVPASLTLATLTPQSTQADRGTQVLCVAAATPRNATQSARDSATRPPPSGNSSNSASGRWASLRWIFGSICLNAGDPKTLPSIPAFRSTFEETSDSQAWGSGASVHTQLTAWIVDG